MSDASTRFHQFAERYDLSDELPETISALKAILARIDPADYPPFNDTFRTADILTLVGCRTSPKTLNKRRSTGEGELPHRKVGPWVQYSTDDAIVYAARILAKSFTETVKVSSQRELTAA